MALQCAFGTSGTSTRLMFSVNLATGQRAGEALSSADKVLSGVLEYTREEEPKANSHGADLFHRKSG